MSKIVLTRKQVDTLTKITEHFHEIDSFTIELRKDAEVYIVFDLFNATRSPIRKVKRAKK